MCLQIGSRWLFAMRTGTTAVYFDFYWQVLRCQSLFAHALDYPPSNCVIDCPSQAQVDVHCYCRWGQEDQHRATNYKSQ